MEKDWHLDIATRIQRPPNDNDTHGWKPFLTPQEIEKVAIVALTSWVFAAMTLVYFGQFNLILFLVCVGFITLLLSLTSGLCLLIAKVAEGRVSWSKSACHRGS